MGSTEPILSHPGIVTKILLICESNSCSKFGYKIVNSENKGIHTGHKSFETRWKKFFSNKRKIIKRLHQIGRIIGRCWLLWMQKKIWVYNGALYMGSSQIIQPKRLSKISHKLTLSRNWGEISTNVALMLPWRSWIVWKISAETFSLKKTHRKKFKGIRSLDLVDQLMFYSVLKSFPQKIDCFIRCRCSSTIYNIQFVP